MSAEFHVTFEDLLWLPANRIRVESRMSGLEIFGRGFGDEYWFKGTENRKSGDPEFDVRFFFQPGNRLLLEISAHPKSIEVGLSEFLQWLGKETSIVITDEDGLDTNWLT